MCQDEIIRRLDHLEFRQELLFENTDVSRFLFEGNVTRGQYRQIMNLMDEYRRRIDSGEEVNHHAFEQSVYEIVPEHDGDYHFAESLAQNFHGEDRWEEVFVALYGDMPKFQTYLNR